MPSAEDTPSAGPAAGWGWQRIDLTDDDIARIESLAGIEAGTLIEVLVPDQRARRQAHVVDERDYAEIAHDLHVSEAVVRKRVSRGPRSVARAHREQTVNDDFVTRLGVALRDAADREERRSAPARVWRPHGPRCRASSPARCSWCCRGRRADLVYLVTTLQPQPQAHAARARSPRSRHADAGDRAQPAGRRVRDGLARRHRRGSDCCAWTRPRGG
jgi:hypothetical protein